MMINMTITIMPLENMVLLPIAKDERIMVLSYINLCECLRKAHANNYEGNVWNLIFAKKKKMKNTYLS